MDRSIPEWTGLLILPKLGDFVLVLFAYVRLPLLDKFYRALIQLLEVIRRVGHPKRNVAKPVQVLLDLVDIRLLLRLRVCVIEPQVADASQFLGRMKIQSNGTQMSQVKVPKGHLVF